MFCSLLPKEKGASRVSCLIVVTILLLGASGTFLLAYTSDSINIANAEDTLTRRSHEEIVSAIENQMSILKWVGGAIVAGLTSAVGLLFRSLERSQAQIHKDLSEGIKSRGELVGLVAESVEGMESEVKEMRADLQEFKVNQNGK